MSLYREGLYYEDLINHEPKDSNNYHTKKIAYAILSYALKSPLLQILTNAGMDNDMYSIKDNPDDGYDVKNEKWGNMMSMGIIDPMKVTRSALQNAISVAITLLSTNAIVTMIRKKNES